MLIHCFTTSEGQCAALSKNDPASLPAELDPWVKLGELEISSSDPDRIGMPTAETLEGLETHGRYFFQI
jgi:hypothetical protein